MLHKMEDNYPKGWVSLSLFLNSLKYCNRISTDNLIKISKRFNVETGTLCYLIQLYTLKSKKDGEGKK